jgi:hypothetical protein
MPPDTARRWLKHPLRQLLNRVVARGHVYADELDDLNLPRPLRAAAEEAIERIRAARGTGHALDRRRNAQREADRYGLEIVEALGEHHETRQQREDRRATLGDPEAVAAVRARREGVDQMVDRIVGGEQ